MDSLKPIEIVVSFTAFSKWLEPPQPIVRERDKEKEKDSNSVITGENSVQRSCGFCLRVNVIRHNPIILTRHIQCKEFFGNASVSHMK